MVLKSFLWSFHCRNVLICVFNMFFFLRIFSTFHFVANFCFCACLFFLFFFHLFVCHSGDQKKLKRHPIKCDVKVMNILVHISQVTYINQHSQIFSHRVVLFFRWSYLHFFHIHFLSRLILFCKPFCCYRIQFYWIEKFQ